MKTLNLKNLIGKAYNPKDVLGFMQQANNGSIKKKFSQYQLNIYCGHSLRENNSPCI